MCLTMLTSYRFCAVFRDSKVSNIPHAVAHISQCTSYNGQAGDCDTSSFQISDVTWSNISGTVSNNLLATLQCSAAAPCTDIVIEGADGLVFNSTEPAPSVECSNVELGPGSTACNGSV